MDSQLPVRHPLRIEGRRQRYVFRPGVRRVFEIRHYTQALRDNGIAVDESYVAALSAGRSHRTVLVFLLAARKVRPDPVSVGRG